MYLPIAKEKFSNIFEIKDGKFTIDVQDKATQKLLYMTINDNVHKNLTGFSVKLFDKDLILNKIEFNENEKSLVVDKLMELESLEKQGE